jgi:hypothetical protein
MMHHLLAVLTEWLCPVCGRWYRPSDPEDSYPHNNHV